jgi:transcriptional regulator with XRE-family HTH domain
MFAPSTKNSGSMQALEIIRQIEELRLLRGFTRRHIASQAEITVQYYSMVVNGKKGISLDVAEKMASSVGLELRLTFRND